MTNPVIIDAAPGSSHVDIAREFDAPVEAVFAAHADPDLFVQWIGPRNLENTLPQWDFRSGGAYAFDQKDPEGTVFGFRGVIHTVVENELIIQTFEYLGAPNQVSLDIIRFESLPNGRSTTDQPLAVPVGGSARGHGCRGHGRRRDRGLREARRAAEGPVSTMARVIADISVSIDGFVTGPNVSLTNGMGDGGMALHAWAFESDPDDQRMLTEGMDRSGAGDDGRNLFDIIDGPDGWSDEVGYGAEEVGRPPFLVLTSSRPESIRLKELDWTFVTTGLADAIDAARDRAGEKDVVLMGGGQLIDTAVAAGLVDVLVLHLAPVILGSGTPLFSGGAPRTFVQKEVVATPNATHLVFEAQ